MRVVRVFVSPRRQCFDPGRGVRSAAAHTNETFFKQEPMVQLTSEGQLSAMFHHGFWQCMDILCDKQYLVEL